jgi:hypothetical protein
MLTDRERRRSLQRSIDRGHQCPGPYGAAERRSLPAGTIREALAQCSRDRIRRNAAAMKALDLQVLGTTLVRQELPGTAEAASLEHILTWTEDLQLSELGAIVRVALARVAAGTLAGEELRRFVAWLWLVVESTDLDDGELTLARIKAMIARGLRAELLRCLDVEEPTWPGVESVEPEIPLPELGSSICRHAPPGRSGGAVRRPTATGRRPMAAA